MPITSALLVFSSALFAGFFGGQVGGGGLLTLPLLILVGLDPKIAIGTNKVAAIFYVLIATATFNKHKKIKLKHFFSFGLVALVGSIIGSFLVLHYTFSAILLKQITIGVLFILALILYFKPNLGLESTEFHLSKKKYVLFLFLLFLISLYGGVLSIAMTTLFSILFILHGQSFLESMSYAFFLSFIILVSSGLIFIANGSVDYSYVLVQAAGGSIGAFVGSKYAIKKGNAWVKRFTLLMILVLLIKLVTEL